MRLYINAHVHRKMRSISAHVALLTLRHTDMRNQRDTHSLPMCTMHRNFHTYRDLPANAHASSDIPACISKSTCGYSHTSLRIHTQMHICTLHGKPHEGRDHGPLVHGCIPDAQRRPGAQGFARWDIREQPEQRLRGMRATDSLESGQES